jgi:uncharacterized protein
LVSCAMLIRVQELELRDLELDEEFQPGTIDLGREVRQLWPLQLRGRAAVVREHEGRTVVADIRLTGRLTGELEMSCARCLEAVEFRVARSFDLLYRPQVKERGAEEVAISEAETEIGFYTGEGLELEDVLREHILLEVPLKMLCREDCRGLCPQCGKDLNRESCGCAPPATDARWNALLGLKDKLQ